MKRKPRRIQLSRRRGWRLPPNTVVVSRPSKWGNPFRIEPNSSRDTPQGVVSLFRMWLRGEPEGKKVARAAKRELRGKNLACWCKLGSPCHADALLEVANADAD